ncbi:hypothetical protein FACS1894166_11440 [Bacilli bacterium]|nr:hypothetical protein FACS1894166_11440 [Bacilli bacterium]
MDDERPTDDNTSVTVFGKLDNFIKGQFNVTLIAPKSEYASFELSKHTLDVNPTLTTPDSVTLTLTLINFPTYPTQDKIIFNGEEDLSLQFNDDWTQNGIL